MTCGTIQTKILSTNFGASRRSPQLDKGQLGNRLAFSIW